MMGWVVKVGFKGRFKRFTDGVGFEIGFRGLRDGIQGWDLEMGDFRDGVFGRGWGVLVEIGDLRRKWFEEA